MSKQLSLSAFASAAAMALFALTFGIGAQSPYSASGGLSPLAPSVLTD